MPIQTTLLRHLATCLLAVPAWGCGGQASIDELGVTQTAQAITPEADAAPAPVEAFELHGLKVEAFAGADPGDIALHIETLEQPLRVAFNGQSYWTIGLPHAVFRNLRSLTASILRTYGFRVEGRSARIVGTSGTEGREVVELHIDGFDGPVQVIALDARRFITPGLPHHVFTSVKDAAFAIVRFFGSDTP